MIYSYTHPLKFPETDPLPTHLSELDFELLYVDVQHEEGEDFEADQGQRSTGHANKFRHVITLTSSILWDHRRLCAAKVDPYSPAVLKLFSDAT